MALSSPTSLLVGLALLFCLITAATFGGLYVIYNAKIMQLSKECKNLRNDISGTGNDINVYPTAYRSRMNPTLPTGVRYAKCICPNEMNHEIQNGMELNANPILNNRRESSLLRCCSSNDTILREKIDQWLKPLDYGPDQNLMVRAVMVGGSNDYEIDLRNRHPQWIQGWSGNTRNDQEVGFVEGIQVEDSYIIVPMDGYYLVHSKIAFRSANMGTSTRIDHRTSVASDDRPGDQCLMRSDKLYCSESGTSYSSFHSGIFKLFRHDQVYVTVSSPSSNARVTFDSDSSLFGLYLLSTL